jgi:hypothetical protein
MTACRLVIIYRRFGGDFFFSIYCTFSLRRKVEAAIFSEA